MNGTIIPPCGLLQAAILVACQKADQELVRKFVARKKVNDAIESACDDFDKEIGEAAFDERDSFPTFEELLKKRLGFLPKPREYGYADMKRLEKAADNAIKAACDLAYFHRIGDNGMQWGKSRIEAKHNRLKEKLCKALVKVSP